MCLFVFSFSRHTGCLPESDVQLDESPRLRRFSGDGRAAPDGFRPPGGERSPRSGRPAPPRSRPSSPREQSQSEGECYFGFFFFTSRFPLRFPTEVAAALPTPFFQAASCQLRFRLLRREQSRCKYYFKTGCLNISLWRDRCCCC